MPDFTVTVSSSRARVLLLPRAAFRTAYAMTRERDTAALRSIIASSSPAAPPSKRGGNGGGGGGGGGGFRGGDDDLDGLPRATTPAKKKAPGLLLPRPKALTVAPPPTLEDEQRAQIKDPELHASLL